ncbi:MAG: single-stranded DNA-binding protein [Tepidisphaeraceae bacterium]
MAALNKVMLIGNLTRDPQLKYLPNQTAVCEFGLAVTRKFKSANGEQREDTAFVDCTVFGRGGEIFNQYMTKGKPVYVEGRLKLDQWEDKNGGGKRSKLSVVVEDFQFLGGRDSGGQGGGGGENQGYGGQSGGGYGGQQGGGYERSAPPARPMQSRPPQQQRPAQQQPPEAPYGEEQQFSDDDIPF